MDVDDAQLRYNSPDFCYEAMAEFLELLVLPLTTALENLNVRAASPLLRKPNFVTAQIESALRRAKRIFFNYENMSPFTCISVSVTAAAMAEQLIGHAIIYIQASLRRCPGMYVVHPYIYDEVSVGLLLVMGESGVGGGAGGGYRGVRYGGLESL